MSYLKITSDHGKGHCQPFLQSILEYDYRGYVFLLFFFPQKLCLTHFLAMKVRLSESTCCPSDMLSLTRNVVVCEV